jgi:hypothetical protein
MDAVAGTLFRDLDPIVRSRMASHGEALARDGAVHIPSALCAEDLAVARGLFDWGFANPGQSFMNAPMEGGPPIRVDAYNRNGRGFYNEMLLKSTIPAIAAAVLGEDRLWYLGEQLFVKDGPEQSCHTPWHQDSDQPVNTFGLFGMWISFESLPKESCLNFIRGSHKGPCFNPIVKSDDGTSSRLLYPTATDMPPFPDIDANLGDYEVLSWPYEPGDVVMFNNMTIHGGGVIPAGGVRRTLSLRFFGSGVKVTARKPRLSNRNLTAEAVGYLYDGLAEGMALCEGPQTFQVFDKHNARYVH